MNKASKKMIKEYNETKKNLNELENGLASGAEAICE